MPSLDCSLKKEKQKENLSLTSAGHATGCAIFGFFELHAGSYIVRTWPHPDCFCTASPDPPRPSWRRDGWMALFALYCYCSVAVLDVCSTGCLAPAFLAGDFRGPAPSSPKLSGLFRSPPGLSWPHAIASTQVSPGLSNSLEFRDVPPLALPEPAHRFSFLSFRASACAFASRNVPPLTEMCPR